MSRDTEEKAGHYIMQLNRATGFLKNTGNWNELPIGVRKEFIQSIGELNHAYQDCLFGVVKESSDE